MKKKPLLVIALLLGIPLAASAETQLLWGDTHLHTKLSPDAYMMGNRSLMPDDAYRYAKGLPVVNAKTKHKIRIHTPLNFLVVSDHAEYMGVVAKVFEGDPELAKTKAGADLMALVEAGEGRKAFFKIVETANSLKPYEDFISKPIRASVWEGVAKAADRHNQPGVFTAFVGWEWSSITEGANLHRVVFMDEGAESAKQFVPYSLFDSDRPEDLWAWLEETQKKTNANFLAIPHNGNVSKGKMFDLVDSDGNTIDKTYAKTRQRWEPIYEMTQIKGDGETLAALSPNDEFAEFETYSHAMDTRPDINRRLEANKGDYARSALMRGLEIEKQVGVNPYQFGMIGASDSHSGVSAVEEDNFGGKFPIDSYPEGKAAGLTPGVTGLDVSAAGLSAVWATDNSRSSIMEAFKRREVYGTTGPRIGLRFFGGWEFSEADADAKDLASVGYKSGVPMGGQLSLAGDKRSPRFLIHAVKDPIDANLDRIQVVKGWLDDQGNTQETVFNVVASDQRRIENNRVEPVGSTVDIESASYTNTIGDTELAAVWVDPSFDPNQRAFYYVRVLQIPTPRHTLYASVAMKRAPDEGVETQIQERAYSSPIWYTPKLR